jgi:hypothetical protein
VNERKAVLIDDGSETSQAVVRRALAAAATPEMVWPCPSSPEEFTVEAGALKRDTKPGDLFIRREADFDAEEWRVLKIEWSGEKGWNSMKAKVSAEYVRHGIFHPGKDEPCFRPHPEGFPHVHYRGDDSAGAIEVNEDIVRSSREDYAAKTGLPLHRVNFTRPFAGIREQAIPADVSIKELKDLQINNFMVSLSQTEPSLNYRQRKRKALKLAGEYVDRVKAEMKRLGENTAEVHLHHARRGLK